MRTPGGNTIKICCKGCAVGPKVTLSNEAIDFGDIEEGKIVKKTFSLQNNSNVDASFAIRSECRGVFHFDKTAGTIPAMKSMQLFVSLIPRRSINYYKRVYIQINDENCLPLDLLGTGYSSDQRPAPFTHQQVLRYRNNVLNKPNKATPFDIMTDFFESDSIISNSVSIDCTSISFGSLGKNKIDYRTVLVRNNTPTKIICEAFVPEENFSASHDTPFNIIPNSIEVPAHSSAPLKVSFKPTTDNQFYSNDIELICFNKNQRSFRLVTESTFVPPRYLSFSASG